MSKRGRIVLVASLLFALGCANNENAFSNSFSEQSSYVEIESKNSSASLNIETSDEISSLSSSSTIGTSTTATSSTSASSKPSSSTSSAASSSKVEESSISSQIISSYLEEILTYSVGLEYELIEGLYSVKGIGNCKDTDIIIPEKYQGIEVAYISSGAFSSDKRITSVTLPNTIIEIKNHAFYCCESLNYIYLSDSLETIGEYAISECEMLEEIVLPESLKTISGYAFLGCSRLLAPNIPRSVTEIGDHALAYCDSFYGIFIPNTVLTMGISVFSWDSNMTNIYCEIDSRPDGWSDMWDYGSIADIHWGTPERYNSERKKV